MKISKITLGTAQLGTKYGIANVNGKPDFKTAIQILNYSWKNLINTFDTSPVYGNSEKIIGSFISSINKSNIDKPLVITKLPAINKKDNLNFKFLYNSIKEQIKQSLYNLKIEKIPFYLIHHAPDIFFKEGLIIECLSQLKEEGLIERIGVSVYKTEEVEFSLEFKEINVIQIPINIFDHRFIKAGLLKRLKKKNLIVFARSIYLQGLLFVPPEKLPNNLEFARKQLISLRNLIGDYNIDINKLAFLFVRDLPEITSLVIGAEKIEQISKNLALLNEEPLPNEIRERINNQFSDVDEKIINPSFWN